MHLLPGGHTNVQGEVVATPFLERERMAWRSSCTSHTWLWDQPCFWQEGTFSELQAEPEEPSFPQPRAGCESHANPAFLEIWGWEAAAALPSPTAFCPLPSLFPDTVPI